MYPEKEERTPSKCVIVFGGIKKDKLRKMLFDDLLPNMTMSGKIEEPFETVRFYNDTLFVCFVSSEYGHNEFYKKSFTFKFNSDYQNFSLVKFKYEVSVLPDRESLASITINEDELINSKMPFSFENWLISGSFFSSENISG